ncbi:MAG: hypothetical protein EB059_04695 [Alphaproteobacteria bacterium]|nr:hypothetical protein [Alphaproteobacteria bacterium]
MIKFFLFMLLFALPAYAQDANPVIHIDKAACRPVTHHVPDADVAYKPGVDVHGKKVVSADLNPSPITHLEDTFRIRLTNDAAAVFGLQVPQVAIKDSLGKTVKQPLVDAESRMGYITLRHGRAYLDDKPLDAAGQGQLEVLCKQQAQ